MDKKFIYDVIEVVIKNHSLKNHDFSNPVKNALNRFADKYRLSDHENASVINYRGEEVYFKECGWDYTDLDLTECMMQTIKYGELHLTHNHNEFQYDDVPREKGIPTFLSKDDMAKLLIHFHHENKEKYIFKSVTAECTNGSRMYIIKNKEFSNADETQFNKA